MKTKKKATRALKIRPLNASYGDAIETIAHHQVKLKMRKWLK